MIELLDTTGNSYYVNPDQIGYIFVDLHCENMIIHTTKGSIEVRLNRIMNRDALEQLTKGNRLINQQEQELIKKYNEESSK